MGCGGILRDNDGHLRGIFFGLLGHLDSHIAEVIAICTAFKLYVESQWFGKFGLVIESESMVAVAWIRNKKLDLSHNKISRAIPKCFTNSSAMATKFKHDAAQWSCYFIRSPLTFECIIGVETMNIISHQDLLPV
ncbi:hypothetical protein GOBAR_AA37684 [Gossypium barbadense]|uniref:RNase H type-1 domain-containing protein n=1 Tax=Gossypium barbadense TaxID=3634 RepID=A0A2P5VW53_GOSBA|nr:hypothetical protein GOBAR_AA37684 [Gossypium barbadense]